MVVVNMEYFDNTIKNEIEQKCFSLMCKAEDKKLKNLYTLLKMVGDEEANAPEQAKDCAAELLKLAKQGRADCEDVSGLCEGVVKTYPQILEFVPWTMQTERMCKNAVEQMPDAIGFVAPAYLSYELCLSAVEKKWLCIAKIPVGMRNGEICQAALQGGQRRAIKFCPENTEYLN